MSLTFGGATTDRDEVAAAASINSLTTWSWAFWLMPTTLTNGRFIERKRNIGHRVVLSDALGNFATSVALSGGGTSFITTGTPLAVNKWSFIGATFDMANAGGGGTGTPYAHHLYAGDLSTLVTECSYGTTSAGTGTLIGDAGVNLAIGGQEGGGNAFQGLIAVAQFYNRVLTLGEYQQLQFRRTMLSGCVLYHELGYNGTSTQPDWSGNGNSGTVTGATQGAHVPTSKPFNMYTPLWGTPPVVAATGKPDYYYRFMRAA